MQQNINEKLRQLSELKPENSEFRQWLADSNLWSWLYSQFRIQGQNISKAAVVDLVNGTIREDVPLSCYGFVQGFKEMHTDMKSDLDMGITPNLKQFKRWAALACPDAKWRRNNPVVFEYALIPCHFNSIDDELEAAFRQYVTSRLPGTVAAAKLFLDIVKVFPIEEESVDMAMAVLLYCIESMGLPVPELSVTEEEFGKMISVYMDHEDYLPFADMLQRSLYNRLDAVVMIARQVKENE